MRYQKRGFKSASRGDCVGTYKSFNERRNITLLLEETSQYASLPNLWAKVRKGDWRLKNKTKYKKVTYIKKRI